VIRGFVTLNIPVRSGYLELCVMGSVRDVSFEALGVIRRHSLVGGGGVVGWPPLGARRG
jgi:hypothetical protein